jgi:site-specific recombinase XerD
MHPTKQLQKLIEIKQFYSNGIAESQIQNHILREGFACSLLHNPWNMGYIYKMDTLID